MSQQERILSEAHAVEALRPRAPRLRRLMVTARQKPLGTFSAIIIMAMIIMAIFAPYISPYDPYEPQSNARLLGPSPRFLFGTDGLGRDLLSRIIFGARISLWVGIISVGLGTFSGSILGLISGYWEGKTDLIIQRIMDSIMAFPALVLAMVMMSVLGPSLNNVMIAIAVVIAPGASRIVRGTVLSVKQNQYVDAARCIGATDLRILSWHILPNVAAPIIIIVSVMLGSAILIEAGLSFLGLGTPPPTPSWGGILSGEGRRNMENAPWIALAPGLAISLAVLAFNLLGDALRDIWDPRLRGSR